MRVIFSTQGESLNVFEAVRDELDRNYGVEKCGFLVSDSSAYLDFLNNNPNYEQRGHQILKEWEITSDKYRAPNLDKLRRYEEAIGIEAGLFGAIVADRRLFMGRDCTYSQDYTRRFSDDELLSILESALEKIEKIFDSVKPDLVVGFICVTMLDYLVYLFARSRSIRYLNIRPTRVLDRVTAASTINDPAPEFVASYNKCKDNGSGYDKIAEEYINNVREKHAKYEGVINPSSKPAIKVNRSRRNPLLTLTRILINYLAYKGSISAKDNHVVNPIRALTFAAIINPFRARLASITLRNKYVDVKALKDMKYVFFPLHTEPEVSLLVYGRPYVNQIEIIRQIAISLPADMCLVLKEHPWMVGKRSLSAYRKMLNIPRVHIVSPEIDARNIIKNASLISVVTGSIALEAAILGKPVITFGDGPFNALPDSMVKKCNNPRELPQHIHDLLGNYSCNDDELKSYVSAVYENSESINLYSVLLKKSDVFSANDSDYRSEIKKLSKLLYEASGKHVDYAARQSMAAAW